MKNGGVIGMLKCPVLMCGKHEYILFNIRIIPSKCCSAENMSGRK